MRYLELMRFALFVLFLAAVPAGAQQPASNSGLLRSALAAQQQGHDKIAIRDYEQFLKAHPRMAEVRANLGVALVHEKQFAEAIQQDRLALSSMPGNVAIRKNLGIAYFKQGDLKDARHELQIVHKALPQNVQVAILLGDCDMRLGKATETVAMLAPMEAENESNTDFEYVLGAALIATGKPRAGATRVEEVAHRTNSASAYFMAGSTRMDMDDYQHASPDLRAALRLNPNLPRIYVLTGMAEEMDGDAAGAVPLLRKALDRNPQSFNANLYLGAILLKRRKMTEAGTYLRHAARLKPSNPTAGYELAMWESTSQHYAAAAKILEALVKSNPDWLQPHVELAMVYYRLKDDAAGKKERAIVAKLKAKQQEEGPPKVQLP